MATVRTEKKPNYVVHLGRRRVECRTKAQAWKAIGNSTFGSPYEVTSPTGKNTDEFVPF